MRVVVFTHTFLPVVGGAEVGIHEIYRRLAVAHDVIVVTPTADDYMDSFTAENARGNLPYEVIRYTRRADRIRSPKLRKMMSLLCLQEFWLLKRLNRSRRIDVVNIHFVSPFGLVALWARRLLHIRTVISLIGRSDVLAELSPIMRGHAELAIRSASAVTQISEYCLSGTGFAKSAHVLPYGADWRTYTPDARSAELRRRLRVEPDQLMLLAAQRLSPVKRVDLLLDVAMRLKTAGRNAVLVVVGKGSEMIRLAAKAQSQRMDNVRLVGYVAEEEMPSYFASADIFVSHSMYETFGLTFAQAMASGLPIVAADTSSVSLVVRDGINGILVRPFELDDFARAVTKLADNAGLRAKIVATNLLRARTEFDWDEISTTMAGILAG